LYHTSRKATSPTNQGRSLPLLDFLDVSVILKISHLCVSVLNIGCPQSCTSYCDILVKKSRAKGKGSSELNYLLVFVKEKKIDATGMSSRSVATVPKLDR
jgi:hypothetical protein